MMPGFMVVLASVTRRPGAALAVYPAGITAAIVLFLPDRHAMLHFVDDETTSVEGLAAMRGADSDPHCHIAQVERPDAMDAQHVLHGEAPQRFGEDALTFLHREFLECLVFQASDVLPLVVIPNPAFKADVAACARVEQLAPRLSGIDGGLGKAKGHHPPATGGIKTTASPAVNRRDQSLNSLLIATFSCSRASVKPYRLLNSP